MPDETQKSTKRPGGWSTARQRLATWDKPALLARVKDLYDAQGANRDFIQARCQTGDGNAEVLEKYRQKVVQQFYPARGFGKLKLGELIRVRVDAVPDKEFNATLDWISPIAQLNFRGMGLTCHQLLVIFFVS